MNALATRIAELREAPLEDLVDEYTRLHGRPPRLRRRIWLWKKIAWKLQADAHGDLSDETRARLKDMAAALGLPTEPPGGRAARARLPGRRKRGDLTPGTVLTRVWHGDEYRVEVLEHGFAYDGVTYRSLSAVAEAITGTHWNGKLFFGLAKRSRDR